MWYSLKLREKLFWSFSLLAVVILAVAAWIINTQVLAQARQEVQEEMKSSLPLYDAVWQEQAGRLSALGMAMAGSPIVKVIFGDPRASRDRETIRQMLVDFGDNLSGNVDLVLVTDGGGGVAFAESNGRALSGVRELPSARAVAASQKPTQSFEILDGRLYHMSLTPVVSHSGSEAFNNTLAVLIAGSELNRKMAQELKRHANSDVLFFIGERLYASSLDPNVEEAAAKTLADREIGHDASESLTELVVAGENRIAFARRLSSMDGRGVGYVVVLHSLAGAGRLFRAISNRLILVGTVSSISVLAVSYLIASRVTRPIESLVAGANELGQGNYEYHIDLSTGGEVGQLASAFDLMRQSIKRGQAVLIRNERLATVGQMAGGIVHDLRNPLAAISAAADLFAKAELSREQRQILAQSQLRASQRMGTMLKELLEFSQGRYVLERGRHNLSALVRSVLEECVSPRLSPGVTVNAHVPENLIVSIDRDRVRRMFENLVNNSIQAMPEGGNITIHAIRSGEKARVTIADTGSGIPAHLRARLFEPFVSHGKEGGTGLGLAVASSIAKAHNGSLTLVSEDDQPAVFCVELPIESDGDKDA